MFLHLSVSHSVHRGGMHGGGGCAWWGACMVGRTCMTGGHAWQGGVMHGGVGGGQVCMVGGHAWQVLRDTVNERAVRILLECILVFMQFFCLKIPPPLRLGNPESATDLRSRQFTCSIVTKTICVQLYSKSFESHIV